MKTNKFLGFLFAVLLVMFFANTANALVVIDNDHVRVTKGDSYWKIAKAMRGVGHIWPKIQKENGYAPNKLPIGAIITIPRVGVIDITNINSAPDGDRAKCVKNSAKIKQRVNEALFLSDEVKKGLISSIENSEPTMTSIKNGETVSHMSSKRGIHYNPEGYRYAIKDAKKLAAYSWVYETDKSFFEVRCIKTCGNTDIRETPKPVKVVEEVPVKEEIPVEVIKEITMIIPPVVEEEKVVVKEVITPEIIPAPPKEEVVEKKSYWDLETKDTIYAGAYDSAEKYDHHSRYWGNEFAAYFFKWDKYRLGYSNKYTGWDGGSNDSKWSGEKIFHGLEILREDGNDETKVRLRIGRTRGKSSGADGNYRSSYTVPMFNVYLGHIQRTDQPKDKWFNEFKYTLSADIDMGKGRQEAYWKGKLVPNAPYKYQAEYSAYVQTDVYQGRFFDYTLGVKGDYSRRDNLYAVEPRIGVEFWNDKAEATIGYRVKEGSGNNSIGANVSLNVDSVTETIIEKPIEWGVKVISGFFRGRKK